MIIVILGPPQSITMSFMYIPVVDRGVKGIWDTGPGGRGEADTPVGSPDHRADRRRDIDRQRDSRLPGAPGRVDPEPRGGEDLHAQPLPRRPGSAPVGLAAADPLAGLGGGAQPRPPRPRRARTPGPAGRPRHAEHRRAPPEGGPRPG